MSNRVLLSWGLGLLAASGLATVRADKFTYRHAEKGNVTVEARLVANVDETFVLELPDGEYRIIPEGAVVERTVGDGPAVATPQQVLDALKLEFGGELFRGHIADPYVIGLILASPLPKTSEARTGALLKKAALFFGSIDDNFANFAKSQRIEIAAPRWPLVVLVFETDTDFEAYTVKITGGRGLSAKNISGFYSGLTNRLAMRLTECNSFDVPLHEAIHQQVYNRNVFQRLAPIPHWFDEGIATGFEAADRKITTTPVRVSKRYSAQAQGSNDFSWEEMLTDDKVFMGDVLAGEAYGQAWGLHWLLVTKYKTEYGKYLRLLASKSPLQDDSPEQRLEDFKTTVGKSVKDLEKEFPAALASAIKKQKLKPDPPKVAGYTLAEAGLAKVELKVVGDPSTGRMQAEGQLLNVSPIRPMSFLVTVETDGGTYSQWHVPDLALNKTVPLGVLPVSRPMQNVQSPGPGRRFWVRVRSAPAESPEAEAWKSGELPVPTYDGR